MELILLREICSWIAIAAVAFGTAQGRLNPETLNDSEYINTVQSYLDGLDND